VTTAPQALVDFLRNRYAVERELGSGGMATVYLAHDLAQGHPVALKVLRPDLVPALGAERFAREIRIASALRHPNLLPVLDFGVGGGVPFYVTPYIEDDSLARRLRREGQLPIGDAIEIAGQIADALQAVHAGGFVHRDVKPGNILLTDHGALLADFGLARVIDVISGEKLTETGLALGTPAYMSPEQSASGIIDGRSDIYSLGCVVYEMLAGAPPFSGPTAQSILARHSVDPVPSLRTVRATVSPQLEQAIARAMAKVPADRYPDAAEFKGALRRAASADPEGTVRRVWGTRRWVVGAASVALGTIVLAARMMAPGSPELDRSRVMVYPLVTSGAVQTRQTTGEDVATLIGNALDGTGPLRWIDAWPLLDRGQRDDIRTLSSPDARHLARKRRCAYYLTGRLVVRGDSADVLLDLNDVSGDSTLARGKASGRSAEVWRLGLQAVNDVLPQLIPGVPRDLTEEWSDRSPAAVSSLLLGEAAFRRLHLSEALGHFREAVRADSTFGLAAIRGAQAATWNHRSDEATALVRVALRQRLAPRYLHFTLGYQAYLEGWADSAAAELRRALAMDPEMTVAWMQLGEVYTHLLPAAGQTDSLAEAAFEEALRLDPSAGNLSFHLIEARLRRGDTAEAARLIHGFLAVDPDTNLGTQIRVMEQCVRSGSAPDAWRRAAGSQALAILSAGNSLKTAPDLLPCATAAFAAVIDGDSTTAGGELRWFALLGLQSALLAQGRTDEAIARIESPRMQGEGTSLYLLDAPVYPAIAERAREVAREYRRSCGRGYRGCANPIRLWELGVWEAFQGNASEAEVVAKELAARAPRPGMPREQRVNPLLARSVAGHAALARGDTTAAMHAFEELLREPMPGEYLTWDVASPRALDRLRLAQLLAATGDYGKAIEVANVLDAAWPSVHLLYLPASLVLRAEAASRTGDTGEAARYRSRLAMMTRSSEQVAFND
jgi:eukaryotic-like serine/threonine-protein kinase